jgi:geranylgeranyl pyrophosphate synthase
MKDNGDGKSFCATLVPAALFNDPLLIYYSLRHFISFLCLASVADDILDVTASSEDLGKTAGKDQEVREVHTVCCTRTMSQLEWNSKYRDTHY